MQFGVLMLGYLISFLSVSSEYRNCETDCWYMFKEVRSFREINWNKYACEGCVAEYEPALGFRERNVMWSNGSGTWKTRRTLHTKRATNTRRL